MTAKAVTLQVALPPCGNCGAQLPEQLLFRAYVFDYLYELDDKIKTGDVNLSICPKCSYRGWFWPGMLIVDRGKNRSVFITFDDFDSDAARQLNECLQFALQELPVEMHGTVKARTLWANNYAQIYPLLCYDDDMFQLDLDSYHAFLERRNITNLKERAHQWMKDSIRISAFVLRGSEGSKEFIHQVLYVLEQEIANSQNADSVDELVRFRDALIRVAQSGLKSRGDDTPETKALTSTEASIDSSSAEHLSEFSFQISPELQTDFDKIINAARLQLTRVEDEDDREAFNAAGQLLGFDRPPIPIDTRTARPSNQPNIQPAVALSPEVSITYGDDHPSLEECLGRAMAGELDMICIVGNVALNELTRGRPSEFSVEVARLFFVNFQVHQVWEFYTLALYAEYLSAKHHFELATALLARAVMALHVSRGELLVPRGAVSANAIVWQRLGRALSHNGSMEAAALCAGASANLFGRLQDTHGEIRSQLDALHSLVQLSSQPATVMSAAALLDKIRQLPKDDQSNERESIGYEIECLSLLADLLLDLTTRAPGIIELSANLATRSVEKSPLHESASNDKKPVLFVPNTNEEPLVSTEEIKAYVDAVARAERPEGDEPILADTEHPPSIGVVFLTTISVDDGKAYVAGAQISRLPWYTACREAIRLSAKHNMRDRWMNLQAGLVANARRVRHPGFSLYLYRVVTVEAERAGFGEIDPEYVIGLLPHIIPALYGSGRQVGTYIAQSSEIVGALQVARTWLAGTAPPQGIVPWWGLSVGELWEAAGRHDDAKAAYQAAAVAIRIRLNQSHDLRYGAELKSNLVRALNRAARTSIKEFNRTRDTSHLWEALNIIEQYRSGAYDGAKVTKSRKFPSQEFSFQAAPGMLRERSVLAIYALFHETELNDGFWFRCFVDLTTSQILSATTLPFGEIYDPFIETERAFAAARNALQGKLPDDIAKSSDQTRESLLVSLERLADSLIPQEVADTLGDRGVERLIFAPEAYLFDVPFAALRVNTAGRRVYPFELGSAEVVISVVPSFSSIFGTSEQNPVGERPVKSVGMTVVTRPTWRPALTPLFGSRAGVERFAERIAAYLGSTNHRGGKIFHGKSVADFLRMVRSCHLGVFFGHGDVSEDMGSVLITDDGIVGELETLESASFAEAPCAFLLLCACSGMNSATGLRISRRELAGVHVALIRRGVRFLVGSVAPLYPTAALRVLEAFANALEEGLELSRALTRMYKEFTHDPVLADPVFWGHITGFGDGQFVIRGQDQT